MLKRLYVKSNAKIIIKRFTSNNIPTPKPNNNNDHIIVACLIGLAFTQFQMFNEYKNNITKK